MAPRLPLLSPAPARPRLPPLCDTRVFGMHRERPLPSRQASRQKRSRATVPCRGVTPSQQASGALQRGHRVWSMTTGVYIHGQGRGVAHRRPRYAHAHSHAHLIKLREAPDPLRWLYRLFESPSRPVSLRQHGSSLHHLIPPGPWAHPPHPHLLLLLLLTGTRLLRLVCLTGGGGLGCESRGRGCDVAHQMVLLFPPRAGQGDRSWLAESIGDASRRPLGSTDRSYVG